MQVHLVRVVITVGLLRAVAGEGGAAEAAAAADEKHRRHRPTKKKSRRRSRGGARKNEGSAAVAARAQLSARICPLQRTHLPSPACAPALSAPSLARKRWRPRPRVLLLALGAVSLHSRQGQSATASYLQRHGDHRPQPPTAAALVARGGLGA